jgi:hypothetical protein
MMQMHLRGRSQLAKVSSEEGRGGTHGQPRKAIQPGGRRQTLQDGLGCGASEYAGPTGIEGLPYNKGYEDSNVV